jgi:integrase
LFYKELALLVWCADKRGEIGVINNDINFPKRGFDMHNDFTLYWRTVPSGGKVVYYYAYDDEGKRHGGFTTGETNKTAARNKCNRLLREGKLIPDGGAKMTFAEYAEGWWEWETCKYLKKRRKRHNITRSYADNNKKMMRNRLVPYFGKMPLAKITPDEIENWIDSMADEGYQNTYTNTIFGTLKTMMIEAVARKAIGSDPTANMERLVNDRREIKIISRKEFEALFAHDWKGVWENDRIVCLANKLAALTGMRASEVLGLKGEYLFADHVYLCKQYDEYGYRDTKTKEKRNIPLAREFIVELEELKAMNGDGFLFSLDGGVEPVRRRTMYDGFHQALIRIGLTDDGIAERRLHLHAWRHFCNTELQLAGVPVAKVQSVIRHKSNRMTELYSHFDPNEFSDVRKAQEDLLHPPKKAASKKAGASGKQQTGKAATEPGGSGARQPLKLVKPARGKPGSAMLSLPDAKAGRGRKQA